MWIKKVELVLYSIFADFFVMIAKNDKSGKSLESTRNNVVYNLSKDINKLKKKYSKEQIKDLYYNTRVFMFFWNDLGFKKQDLDKRI